MMKMVVTYETADIQRLIRHDLARQGITAVDADIKFTKNQAVVSVEVTPDDAPPPVAETAVASPPTPAPAVAPTPPPTPPPPKLEAVEGGAGPVDMTDIFRASQRIASTTEGKFPVPQHAMLDGESTEWPGEKS
jgi:hypothetical protein